MKRRDVLRCGVLGAAGLALGDASWLAGPARAGEGVWKFGLMADTQWANAADVPDNPGTCAVHVIQALNREFIRHGVRFVVQVGDLVDKESWDSPASFTADPLGNVGRAGVRTLPYRAWAAQPLYDAGIGFFPLRGNHESSSAAARELPALFPQTSGAQGGRNLLGVRGVMASDISNLQGLSYGIDAGNVRLVLLDQFDRAGYLGLNNNGVLDQLQWVDRLLAERPADCHAFVLGHKNLCGQSHRDCLLGRDTAANPEERNRFMASLRANGVHAFVGGHDHMHHRSVVVSPDGSSVVEQLIAASNSSKFYTPQAVPNIGADNPDHERPLAQELYAIGYYIFTVDGPCVTVDYFSTSHGLPYGDADLQASPPGYAFKLRERFGYSLNGKRFDIAQDAAYTEVRDTFDGTEARILSGTNGDGSSLGDGRRMAKSVRTGWQPRPQGAASARLTLWGLAAPLCLWRPDSGVRLPVFDRDVALAEPYGLSLSYDAGLVAPQRLAGGDFCLRARRADGVWTKAVELNVGGAPRFVPGPYRAGYGLGTHGVDPESRTVWAVVNHCGSFVAA